MQWYYGSRTHRVLRLLSIMAGSLMAVSLLFSVASCGAPAPEESSYEDTSVPETEETEEGVGTDELEYAQITTPDGRKIDCIWHYKGNLSCDWSS